MAYDIAHRDLVLFGGAVSGSPRDDTWTWDGTTWIEQSPATVPWGREGASIAYDAATQQLVLFGGYHPYNYLAADTWTWDGVNWTQLHPPSSPPARSYASMAYDAARGRLVLFGGQSTSDISHVYNDTWTWDGTTWAQQVVTTSPGVRYSAAMAYDEDSQTTLLFGGWLGGGQAYGDTWEWTGTNWIARAPRISPTQRGGASMAFEPQAHLMLLNGGAVDPGLPVGDTWLWNGVDWFQDNGGSAPGARYWAVMAYDRTSLGTLMFGGAGAGLASDVGDTWTWVFGANPPTSLGQLPTSTRISSAPNPSIQGQAVTFVATVGSAANAALQPSGSVTFSEAGKALAIGHLEGGVASWTTSSLPIGEHFVGAAYGGDTFFAGSAAVQVAQVVSMVTPPAWALSGLAASAYTQQLQLFHGTPLERRVPDGGQEVCELAVPNDSNSGTAGVAGGLLCNGIETPFGVGYPDPLAAELPGTDTPLVATSVNEETVGTSGDGTNGVVSSHSRIGSMTFLAGVGPGGTDIVSASALNVLASASCLNGRAGAPSGYSSIGKLSVAGTVVETQPIGSRIIVNPTGGNGITLSGNPIVVNPTGARVPMAIVTLNHSRVDPALNSQVASAVAIEFPVGGALSSIVSGTVYLSYAKSGISGCS